MKRHGGMIAFGVAIGFGVLAVLLTSQWMKTRGLDSRQADTPATAMAKLVVAAKDLDIGTPITANTLTLADWPKANTPKGAYNSMTDLEGRVLKVKLVAGAPLLASELAPPGSGAGLVALIANGKRAMSIKVDEVVGVSGFVLPNTFVDVLAVDKGQDANKGTPPKVTTILERIKVLAIAQETFTEEGKAKVVRTVTLELDPEQGEKLALKSNNGFVHLTLRNPLDTKKTIQVAKNPLPPPPQVSKKRNPPAPDINTPGIRPPEYRAFEVEVIKGQDRETIKFKSNSSAERT